MPLTNVDLRHGEATAWLFSYMVDDHNGLADTKIILVNKCLRPSNKTWIYMKSTEHYIFMKNFNRI